MSLCGNWTAGFPQLSEKSQDVFDEGTILPEPDYQGTRGYIESLAKQINASYEHNIFDGCAVLMRRLFEILLILRTASWASRLLSRTATANFQMLERLSTTLRPIPSWAFPATAKGA